MKADLVQQLSRAWGKTNLGDHESVQIFLMCFDAIWPQIVKETQQPRWTDGDFLDAALAAATGSILSPYAADKIRAYAREMREKQCGPHHYSEGDKK